MSMWDSKWCLRSALLVAVLLLALPLGMSARAAVRPNTSPSPRPSAAPAPFTVTDESHVLPAAEVNRLKNTAASVGQHIWIYTTTRFATDKVAFDKYYKAKLTTLPGDSILIAINTKSRHFLLASGPNSNLTDAAATTARGDFTYSFQVATDYGLALNTALQSIGQSVNAATPTEEPYAQDTPAAAGQSGSGSGSTILAVVVAAGLIVIFAFARRGAGSRSSGGRYRSHHRYRRSSWSSAPAFLDTSSDSSPSFDFGGSDSGGGGASVDFGPSGDSGGGTSSGDF